MRTALVDLNTGEITPQTGDMAKVPDGDGFTWQEPGFSDEKFAVMTVRIEPVADGHRATGRVVYAVENGEVVGRSPAEEIPIGSYAHPLRRWQFQAMVNHLGIDAAIRSAIETAFDGLEREKVLARYSGSDVYNRSDPLFDMLAPLVGLDLADLDAAWMQIAGGE